MRYFLKKNLNNSDLLNESSHVHEATILDKISCKKKTRKSALIKCCIFLIWKVMKCTYLS